MDAFLHMLTLWGYLVMGAMSAIFLIGLWIVGYLYINGGFK